MDPRRPRLKLLFVTPDPSDGGGVAVSSRRIMASLAARGHTVVHLHPDAHRFPGDTERGSVWRVPRCETATWARFVEEAVHAHDIDVAVGFYGWGPAQAVLAGAVECQTAVALRGNDLDRDFLQPGRHALVRWAIERADGVCTVSEEMANKVARWCGRGAVVVGNGVDTSSFQPVDGRAFRETHGLTGPVFGMFGELKPKRGVEILREVVKLGWTPLVVGRIRPSVQHLVPQQAVVVEWIDRNELPAAYAACDVIGQPSHADGLPNVVLEAMACGRTVIATERAGMRDVITHGETGFFIRDDLAGALESAMQSDVGPAARQAVPTLAREAKRWTEFLEGLC